MENTMNTDLSRGCGASGKSLFLLCVSVVKPGL